MRILIKEFVNIIAKNLSTPEPIFEFGALQISTQEEFANIRSLFPDKEYIGCDMREGPGVDKVLNLHNIELPSESVGTVIILDTLEHVEFPRKAIEEAHRILKADGILVITSVMYFPIHNYPADYWRYTPEAFKSLLKPFKSSFVDFAGESEFPHTIIGIGFKGDISEDSLSRLKKEIETWKWHWSDPALVTRHIKVKEALWKKIIKLFTPPILFNLYQKIRK